jgi:hypothetical protein
VKSNIRLIVAALVAVGCASDLRAAIVGPGDIVAPQFDNVGTIIVVHPATQQREILSFAPNVGAGPAMSRPMSIVRLADGNFLVADTFAHQALTEVNAATGNRTDIASGSIGTGAWGSPNTVLLTPAGDTIMVSEDFVARVNLSNGNRTLISGNGVGAGPGFAFNGAGGADFDKLGHVVIGVYDQPAVYDVDLVTGTRSILSGLGQGSGPALSHIMDLVVLPNGQIMAEGRHFETDVTELFRIDPITGDRTLVATHPSNNEYERLALGSGGVLLASDPFRHAIFAVDPTSGAETLISGNGLGTGPQLFWGDMVQIPIPEPTSMLSFATGAVLLSLFLGRSRRLRDGRPSAAV